LVINAEKCIFGVPSIDFLGHRVDAAGVTPLPQYVSAVVDFPQPSTVKELQAFLGMLNFYRRFLPAIADILRPLTDSLRGGKKGDDRLEWSTAMLHAFQASKKALTDATYLAHPLPGASLSLRWMLRRLMWELVCTSAARDRRSGSRWVSFPRSWSRRRPDTPPSTGSSSPASPAYATSVICWKGGGLSC
jgi:hypothetical protein